MQLCVDKSDRASRPDEVIQAYKRGLAIHPMKRAAYGDEIERREIGSEVEGGPDAPIDFETSIKCGLLARRDHRGVGIDCNGRTRKPSERQRQRSWAAAEVQDARSGRESDLARKPLQEALGVGWPARYVVRNRGREPIGVVRRDAGHESQS